MRIKTRVRDEEGPTRSMFQVNEREPVPKGERANKPKAVA